MITFNEENSMKFDFLINKPIKKEEIIKLSPKLDCLNLLVGERIVLTIRRNGDIIKHYNNCYDHIDWCLVDKI